MAEERKTSTSPSRPSTPPGRNPHGGRGPAEKPKNLKGSYGKLLEYMGPFRIPLLIVVLLAAGSACFSIIGPKILGNATTELYEGLVRMINGTGGIDFNTIGRILLFLLFIYCLSAILQFLQGFLMSDISSRVTYNMRRDITMKIERLPLKFFDTHSYGEILSHITNDVDTVSQSLNQSVTQIVSSFTTLVGILIMMLTISPMMTLIAVCILPVALIITTFIAKRSQKYFIGQQVALGEVNGHIEEMYGNHVIVKAFNGEEASNEEFATYNEKLYTSAWKSQFLSGLMQPSMSFISNIGYVIICVVGGNYAAAGVLTIGSIQAFIQYMRQFVQPLSQVANISNIIQQTGAASERIFEFLGQPEEEPDPNPSVSTEGLAGEAMFAHVSFGYDPEKIIIHDFSAVVEAGKTVALVGPTGAGKTTIVKLLMRYYDVNSGAVLIDEYDVRQFKRNDLRKMFGMVLQDTWLYNASIMENIRYGRLDATDEEVIAAAKAAQADHFIRTLPDGYNMEINEESSNISQGQKQLLTIARALLSDPKILILDEATSSVDTRTEVLIQKAMATIMEGRTNFVIAHRLSTIRDADLILVLDHGDIIEQGTHDSLLAKKGFYASLYESQFSEGD